MIQRTCRANQRRGVAVVEFALLAPLLLMLLLGMWEVGRMLQMQQSLSNAAREGGRQASTGLLTNAQVQQVVKNYLDQAGVPTQNLVVNVTNLTNGGDVSNSVQMDQLQVDVNVPLQDFRWVSLYLVTDSSTIMNARTIWYSYKDQDFPTTPNPLPGS
jgi:Flp pilus assembly protein TadG